MRKLHKKTVSLYSDKFILMTQPLHVLIHEAKYSVFPILKVILFVFLVQFEAFAYFPMNLLVY